MVPLSDAAVPVPRRGTMTFPLSFAPQQLRSWDAAPAVWEAVSSDYWLARGGLEGDTVVVASRAIDPSPLPAVERDSITAYVRTLAGFRVSVPGDARPSHVSPLRWFVTDDEEHLWVCATGLRACSELDVFDLSGRFLGTVALPAGVQDWPRPLIRGGILYAAVEGEGGQPQLFRGRILRP